MIRKLCALIIPFLLIAIASAQENPTTAVFDMDKAGNAHMTVTQIIDDLELDVVEAQVYISADAGNLVSFSSRLVEDPYPLEDYTIKLESQGNDLDLFVDLNGEGISSVLNEIGDFDFTVTLRESGGALYLEATGTMRKDVLETLLMLDADSLIANPETARSYMQDSLNALVQTLPSPVLPDLAVTEFSASGGDVVTVNLKMQFGKWGEAMAAITKLGYQEDAEMLEFTDCLGWAVEDITDSLLGADIELLMRVAGSGDSITLNVDGTASSPISATGASLESISFEATKLGPITDMEGSIITTDSKTIMSCLFQDYLPGDYEVESLEFTLLKKRDEDGKQSMESRIARLAKRSGNNYELIFPSEVTRDMDITVKTPSGMSILSVQGGSQEGSAAKSQPGEEFSVVYSGGGAGIDTNLIILIVVVLVVVYAISRRKKPGK